LQDPDLLTDPQVSPTYLQDFHGLSSRGMFITCGAAELMQPDIKVFADKVKAAGVLRSSSHPMCCVCHAAQDMHMYRGI
jgi:acetyl esterase/lipase